jgi:hypothetical protein
MTRTITLIAAVAVTLVAVPAAWSQGGPDAFERAVNAASRPANVALYPDAFERAANAATHASAVSVYPDAVQRALNNRISSLPTTIPGDHHERFEALGAPAPVSVSSSGSDVEWPQVGIGFGMGALLALGLVLTLRLVRARELAH